MSALAFIVLLGLSGGAGGPPGEAAREGLDRLMESARATQEADVASWGRHRFRRRALREKLDGAGAVVERERLEFLVMPRPGSDRFEELLTLVDGREPTGPEIERRRQEGLFTKHYRALRTGEGSEEQGSYSMRDLLRVSSYRYAGRERIGGSDCHRIDFEPDLGRQVDGIEGKIARAMAGSLWLTVDGLHLARATARSVRPISIVFALARVTQLRLSLESVPVGDGPWLPGRVEVWTDARVLGIGWHRHNLYLYDRFEPAPLEGEPAGRPGD